MIDNFDVAGDEGLEDLQSLGAQVILTTRQDFRPHFAQVDLNELEEEDAYRLFLRHAALGKDDREAEARELIRQVGRHTTAVILLAAQKEADGLTTGQLLGRLKQGLRQAGESSVQLRKDGRLLEEGNAFQVLCAVLNAAELPQEERMLLANLSLFGSRGMDPGRLCRWCGLPNRNSLNRLVKRHWVERAEGRVFLSPVIGQVAFETAGAGFAACGPLLQEWDRWYGGLSRREQHLWRETLQTVGSHLWRLVEGEDDRKPSGETAFILESFGRRCYGQKLQVLSERLYREALKLRRKLAEESPSVYEPDVATTCNNLAVLLSDSPEGQQEAEALYREALVLRREQAQIAPEVYWPDLARVCWNLGRLLQAQGRTEEAEALFQEAKGEGT